MEITVTGLLSGLGMAAFLSVSALDTSAAQYREVTKCMENEATPSEVSRLLAIETELDKEPPSRKRQVTDSEYRLLARMCMSECGGKWGEPTEGKIAVIQTVLNRVDMGFGSIEEVIWEPGQYSLRNNGEPDGTVYAAVEKALLLDEYPDNMIYFRTKRYHGFGKPYAKIGNHYFSLSE